tara:strand:+ start:12899 stop:13096 length:198 start_codon:yes stop_codon:yes gene_type:complete
MSSLLAKIQVHPGKEAEFEDVMAYMYRKTHGTEEGVLRYDYWRGREPAKLYPIEVAVWWQSLRQA